MPMGAFVVLITASTFAIAGCATSLSSASNPAAYTNAEGSSGDRVDITIAEELCPSERHVIAESHVIIGNSHCPYTRSTNHSLLVPGIVVTAIGAPLVIYGAEFATYGTGADRAIGIPAIAVLSAGIAHEIVGVALIAAGATTKHWKLKRKQPVGLAEGLGISF
jgi:hypothetical protein